MDVDEKGAAWVMELARRGEAEFDALIASMPDAVYLGDFTGIKKANRVALDMLGFETLEDLNAGIPTLAEKLDNRDARTGKRLRTDEEAFVRAMQGEACVREVICRHQRTGEDIIVRCAAAPVRLDGKIVGAIAVNTDITEQKRAEAALRNETVTKRLVRGLLRGLAEDRDASVAARRRLGEKLADEFAQASLAEHVAAYRGLGLGDLVMTRDDAVQSEFTGKDLIEATPGHGRTTCYLTLAFLEAAHRHATKGGALGTETRCQSKGDAACVFVVRSRPQGPT